MIAWISFLAGVGTLAMLIQIRQKFWSFASQNASAYANDNNPPFDIRTALNGTLACDGVIYGPTGRVTSRFTAEFRGEWSGNVGTLKETFYYDSGAVQDREWKLTVGNDGRIAATAADIVGKAEGNSLGSAVNLRYAIRLSDNAGGHVLNAIDWMYITADGTIINRSQFRKYGIKVAELVATIRPKDAA